jgi:molybdopterin-guanine dinucleotide biosynthesis protein A
VPEIPNWFAVLLAGGTSRRWGGVDKTAHPLAGVPLLQHAAAAVLPRASAVVVVAPADHPARPAVEAAAVAADVPMVWTREDQPGGGPLAGLAAGVAAAPDRTATDVDRVAVVLAADHPFAGTAVARLIEALTPDPTVDAAIGVDPDGRRQPLLAAYREAPLRLVLAGLDPAGRPLRAVLDALHVVEVPVTEDEALDLDTPVDAETAARLLDRYRAE